MLSTRKTKCSFFLYSDCLQNFISDKWEITFELSYQLSLTFKIILKSYLHRPPCVSAHCFRKRRILSNKTANEPSMGTLLNERVCENRCHAQKILPINVLDVDYDGRNMPLFINCSDSCKPVLFSPWDILCVALSRVTACIFRYIVLLTTVQQNS